MDIVSTILTAAKAAKVSGALLLAVCSHESGNFQFNYSADDNGSPSHGVCQVKFFTAKLMGFKGKAKDLNNPKTNARYAALYLKYQEKRYGNDWVKIVAAYNSGTYNPSKLAGCPRNLRYLRLVQQKLPVKLQHKLDCGEK